MSNYPGVPRFTIRLNEESPQPPVINLSLLDLNSEPRLVNPTTQQPFSNIQQQHNISPSQQSTSCIETKEPIMVKLQDLPKDPNSPFVTNISFEEILGSGSEDLLKGIYCMSYSMPSKIQRMAIPLILADPPRNLIAQSQSGTGKTAAFVLAMLKRIDPNLKQTQAICLAPSRELARQMLDSIQEIARFLPITSAGIVKDVFKTGARERVNKNQMLTDHIIVGTPGIILNCLRRRQTINVNHLKMFVLDEADNMLDYDGLGDQSIRIRNLIPVKPQILLFSATFPDYVCRFARKFAPDPQEITLTIEELSVKNIAQCYMDCIDEEQKYNVVCNIYDVLTVSQSIIFCKRRSTADIIARQMRELGHLVGCIHGEMTPDQRDVVIDDFRRGIFKVLVTTNLISRGIDISTVSLVINYDIPLDRTGNPDAEVYLHRIGRTGRFGHTGISIIFVHDEVTFHYAKYLEDYFKVKMRRIPTEDWQAIEKIFKEYI